MIFKIAWRNIWRSKIRSLTVVGSIVVGVWALTFIMAFYEGFIDMYITSAVENDLSHIQIHNPKFGDEKEVQYTISNSNEIRGIVKNTTGVKAFTSRSLTAGMIANSKGSRGCQIRGIHPTEEAQLTQLDKKIIDGAYFSESKKRNPIIVGKTLAEKMKLKIKSKVVLTFQTPNGELVTASFKVIGIYKGGNGAFEESNLFVQQKDVTRLIGDPTLTHEVALLVNDVKEMTRIQSELVAKCPDALVETYAEISPDVNLYETQMSFISYIIVTIVMFALIFGIINAMLMAILERTRELGMLMAVGMNKGKIFSMIIVETVCIGMIAAPIGLLLGFLTVSYYGSVGIDMTEGMGKIISEVIYPELDIKTYLTITVAVAITAVLGALYPASKAIRLKPVDAIRSL